MKMVYNVNEVSRLLGVHPETVRRWIRMGKLSAIKSDGRNALLISYVDVMKFIESHKAYLYVKHNILESQYDEIKKKQNEINSMLKDISVESDMIKK